MRCSIVLVSFILTTVTVHADELIEFDIAPQRADHALIRFAQQANQNILFSYQEVQKFQTNQLKGFYPPEYALERLLRDSGLALIKSQQGKFSVKPVTVIAPPAKTTIVATPILPQRKDTIEKIAIVGSRVSGRTITDLPVAVDIFDQHAINSTGYNQLGNIIQALAPSFNFSSSVISDGSSALQPATLRGLGPDQTLILINGKRRHQASLIHINNSVGRGTAGVDINALPISAISYIEILRDGAAAQYGSDAIAGVINIVLKGKDQPSKAVLSYGQYTKGDGETTSLSIHNAYSSEKADINVTLDVKEHGDTNRAGQHGACQFYGCKTQDNGQLLLGDPREADVNRNTFKVGDTYFQQLAIVANANYDTSIGEFYGFATYSQRDNRSAAFFRHHANSDANPVLQDNEPVFPLGYLPHIESDMNDYSISMGNTLDIFEDGQFDLSYTYGKNTIDYTTIDSLNASYANMEVKQNQLSANEIRRKMRRKAFAYGLSLSLQTFNIDYRQHFDRFHLAAGIEMRRDRYQVKAGDEYSYQDYDNANGAGLFSLNKSAGIQGFPGISPSGRVNEQRDMHSAYIDIESYVTEDILLTSALRYDHGDGFGGTVNYKLAGHWQTDSQWAFRAAINSGFRAPSMQQLYFNNISSQYLVNEDQHLVAERVKTFRNDSNVARAIGINSLEEERSFNLSLGGVYTYNDALTMTLDFYAIDIDDRIVISNKLGGELANALSTALLNKQASKGQFFLNGADTETRGVDLVISWSPSISTGQFSLIAGANYSDTDVSKLFVSKQSLLNKVPEEIAFSKRDISIIEEWQPNTHINVSSHYRLNRWAFDLTLNHFGDYTLTDGESQRYGAELLTNVNISYAFSKKLSMSIGGNNIFGVTPDRNKIGNSAAGNIVDNNGQEISNSAGVFTYSRRSAPFGFNGAYFFAGIEYLL